MRAAGYGYDPLGRLTTDTRATGITTLRAAGYGYDSADDRTSSTLAPRDPARRRQQQLQLRPRQPDPVRRF
jgi:YD repeat-containing protein